MKIPHKKRDCFVPVILAVSIVVSAVCFASHMSGTSTVFSKGLSAVTTPLQKGAKNIYNLVSSAKVYFDGIDSLKAENEHLLRQNKKLSEENETVKKLRDENNSLYKFLELKKEHTDYDMTNANVISKSIDGYTSVFTVDKGSFHGIGANMPVITDDGALVGITYSVDLNSCRCKSILSYDMNIGVYDLETGETGILSGSFDTFSKNSCVIKAIPETSTFSKGDTILTSGLGETYPRGLKIGTIKDFIPEQGTHAKSAVVEPLDSSFAYDRVMIITDFERYYE